MASVHEKKEENAETRGRKRAAAPGEDQALRPPGAPGAFLTLAARCEEGQRRDDAEGGPERGKEEEEGKEQYVIVYDM